MIDLEKVSIGQFIDYCHLIDEWKPKLAEKFGDRDDMSVAEIFLHFPEYVEDIVKFWTGWTTVKDKDMDMVLGLFGAIEKLSVVPDAAPVPAFEYLGEWYKAPSELQLLKKVVPMGKATFGQTLEAMQIEQLMNGNYDMIPYVLAVIFLKDGELLDDLDVSQRAELLRGLPITTATNAYFFLASSASTWLKRITRYLAARLTHKLEKPVSTA